jgi:hypothetical protein
MKKKTKATKKKPCKAVVKKENNLPQDAQNIMANVVMRGDLAGLTDVQIVQYHNYLCKSLKLNPLTQPFGLIKFIESGKERKVLYAQKNCAEQLRDRFGVSITKTEIVYDIDTGMLKAYVEGRDRTGRTDAEIGVVFAKNVTGLARANLEMKALTKGKRRLTLSMCGLGLMDETEVADMPGVTQVGIFTGKTIEVTTLPVKKSEPEQMKAPIADEMTEQERLDFFKETKEFILGGDSVKTLTARAQNYKNYRSKHFTNTEQKEVEALITSQMTKLTQGA